MKYIRTKDGIYENKPLEKHLGKRKGNGFEIVFKEQDIVKQADTIEELCDGYVITSKQGHIYDSYGDYGYELKEVLPQAREECPYEDWDLYGCILIDGIIKQVAKMNDKGELGFYSIEPILEPIDLSILKHNYYIKSVIIGAETGNRKGKVIPKKEWILDIVKKCDENNVKVFMKESLRQIMGNDFRQDKLQWYEYLEAAK